MPITLKLFFTTDNGPDAIKLTELELMDCSDPHKYLRPAGTAVLKAYDELLMMLEGRALGLPLQLQGHFGGEYLQHNCLLTSSATCHML